MHSASPDPQANPPVTTSLRGTHPRFVPGEAGVSLPSPVPGGMLREEENCWVPARSSKPTLAQPWEQLRAARTLGTWGCFDTFLVSCPGHL